MNDLIENLEEKFKGAGISGRDFINEIFRCKVVDQILASNPATTAWGVTLDELYGIAAATVDIFGPLLIDKSDYGALYQASFTVDPVKVVEYTPYVEDILFGEKWKDMLYESVAVYNNEVSQKKREEKKKRILFAHVEEYAGFVDYILQECNSAHVILYAGTAASYELLHKVYPLADIRNEWPKDELDHVFYVHSGVLSDIDFGLQEVAYYYETLRPTGTGRFFINSYSFYSNNPITNEAKTFLFNQYRLSMVGEWLPFYAYELKIGNREYKKVTLRLFEKVDEKIVETKLVPLPHLLLTTIERFTIAAYVIQSGGLDPVSYHGARRLFDDVIVGQQEEQSISFRDDVGAALWALFGDSAIGLQIMDILHVYCQREESILQLYLGAERPIYDEAFEQEVANSFAQAYEAYEDAKSAAEEKWAKDKKTLHKAMNL